MSKLRWSLGLWLIAGSVMLNQVSGVPVASARVSNSDGAGSTFKILRDWVLGDQLSGKRSGPSLLRMGGWILDSMGASSAIGPDDYPVQPATSVGTLPGNFSVDRFGNANYSVPLEVPPGVNGMQPELGLSYSSGRGMGMVGMGFAVSGLSSIARCPKTLVLDGANVNVQLTQDDALCLDGQRLVLVDGAYGAAGSEYRTRRETFRKIVSNRGINDEVSSFTVYTKDGRILTYGGSSESRLHAWPDVNYQWSLSRVEDRFGNYMTIDYAVEPGDAWVPTEHPDLEGEVEDFFYAGTTGQRPTEIRYTGNDGKAPQRWVEFKYDDLDTHQHLDGWKSGGRIHHVVRHILTDIVMHGPADQVVRSYRLGYTDGPTTNRPRLETLQLCDGDGDGAACMPPTRFEWEPGETTYDVSSDTAFSGLDYVEAHPSWEANCNDGPRPPLYQLTLDVDADGSQDFLIARGQYDLGNNPPNLVGFDNPCNGEFYWQIWPTRLGDRTSGDMPWDGQGFEEVSTGISVQTRGEPHVINYDGDFRDDIIYIDQSGAGAEGEDYYPYLSVMESVPVDEGEDPAYGGPWLLGPASGTADESMHIRDLQTLDLNGDGFQDLMTCRGAPDDDYGYWYYLLHNGTSGDYVNQGFPLDAVGTPLDLECTGDLAPRVMDFDGDRNQELLVVPEVENGQIIHHDDRSPQYYAVELDLVDGEIAELLPTGLPNGIDSVADINGDGLQDGLTVEPTESEESLIDDCDSSCSGIRVWENVGGRFVEGDLVYQRNRWTIPSTKALFLGTPHDRNSDGRVDIPFGAVSRTDTTITTRRNLLESYPGAPVIHRDTLSPNTSTLGFDETTEEEILPTVLPHSIVPIGDVNGDGLHDLASVELEIHEGEVTQRTWNIHVHRGKQPDMLNMVTNGYGATIEIGYEFTRQKDRQYGAYDVASQCSNPEICHTGPRPVVSFYVEDTDIVAAGDRRVHQLQYEDGRTKQGLGWLGFKVVRDVEVIDNEIRKIHQWEYDLTTFSEELQVFPFADIATREIVEVPLVEDNGDTRLWIKSTHRSPELWDPQVSIGAGGFGDGVPYFPVISWARTEEFEVTSGCTGRVTADMGAQADLEVDFCTNKDLTFNTPFRGVTTERSFDEYGTVTDQTVTYSDGHVTSTHNDRITNDPDEWLLGLIGLQVVTDRTPVVDSESDQKSRTWEAYYDEDTGALRQRIVEPGNQDLMVNTWLTRDIHGNITTESSTDGWGQQRLDVYIYDDEGVFPIQHNNGLFQATTTQWRRGLGVPFAVTDPNGVSQVTVHDSFGRVVAEERLDAAGNPDGARVDHEYQRIEGTWVGQHPRLRKVTAVAGGEETQVEYDQWGREVHRSTTGYFGRDVATRTEYDDRGFIEEVAELDESGNTVTSTESTYDNLGRPITIRTGDNRVTLFEYEGQIRREINPVGTVTETEVDERDRVVRVHREGGLGQIREDVVCYVYDAFGAFRRVKKAPARFTPGGCVEEWWGYTVEYESDAYGNNLVVNDRALGTREYRYDGFGNVQWSKDAKGQEADYDYDALGRLTGRDDADGLNSWIYDTQFVGALYRSESSDGHAVEHQHDAFGRLSATSYTMEGRTYSVHRVYDEYSRLYWLRYPSSQTRWGSFFWVAYRFDEFGHVIEVRSKNPWAEHLLWNVLDVDHRGRITEEQDRGGTTTERDIDPHTGAVASIVHRDKNGELLQRLEYEYDENLNLQTRSEQYQFFYQEENFRYDALDRVENATVQSGGQQRSVDARYNYFGDIAELDDVAYDYDNRGRLETAGSFQFAYDANGNVVQRQTLTGGFPLPPTEFSYNAQNMLRDMTTTSDFLEYEYDADRNRVLRRSAAEDTTTYYIGDLMEEIWEEGANRPSRRYKIHADGRVVAQVLEAPATDRPARTRYFLHHDHLGSPTLVTDQGGNEVQRMYYDMWGAKRGGNWASSEPYLNPVGINVGFTSHEEQIDGGLMNMRGRMYDPKLGRFMSPDPIVARPETLQGWNRYAYVQNNPLTRVDPSGHLDIESVWGLGDIAGFMIESVAVFQGTFNLGEAGAAQISPGLVYRPLAEQQGAPPTDNRSDPTDNGVGEEAPAHGAETEPSVEYPEPNTPYPDKETAARAAAAYIHKEFVSLKADVEYGARVYLCPGGYCFTNVNIGYSKSVLLPSESAVPLEMRLDDSTPRPGQRPDKVVTFVANLHYHPPGNGVYSHIFSPEDYRLADKDHSNEYLLTSAGVTLRYHPFGVFRTRRITSARCDFQC